MSDLTPEERVRRVKAALAEAGYPDVWVVSAPHPLDPSDFAPSISRTVPAAVAWRAMQVADPSPVNRCWPCWSHEALTGERIECDHDPLTSPWPEVVR